MCFVRGWDVFRCGGLLHVHGNMLKRACSKMGGFLSQGFSVKLGKYKQEPTKQGIL